jgi:hypothetical protein
MTTLHAATLKINYDKILKTRQGPGRLVERDFLVLYLRHVHVEFQLGNLLLTTRSFRVIPSSYDANWVTLLCGALMTFSPPTHPIPASNPQTEIMSMA